MEIPCEIVNFCQAGLFLKLSEANADVRLPRDSGVEVIFVSPNRETTFRLAGRLSHPAANGVGFVFDLAPPFQVLLALQEKALPPTQAGWKMPAEFAELHTHCLRALENALYPLLDKLPARIEDDLAEEIERGKRKGLMHPKTVVAPLPEAQSRPIVERFFAHALAQAKGFIVPDLSLQPEEGVIYGGSESQRLMFEDWMNLIDKAILLEAKHGEVLRLLETRFSALLQREIANHNNPFGPNVLCHSFHYSLQGIALGNFHRNFIYQTFTHCLDERLEKLYGDLRSLSKPLDALIKPEPQEEPPFAGVFNAAQPLFAKTPVAEEIRHALVVPPFVLDMAKPLEDAASHAPSPGGAAPRPAFARRVDAFSVFVMLSRYAEFRAGAIQADAGEVLADAERAALVAALRKLQASIPSQPPPYLIAPKLHASLGQILAETGQAGILACAEVRENLQTLGLLLDAMLGDSILPACATTYIKRLQIPLLIVAFTDSDVMHSKDHPAWQVFNQLDLLRRAANFQGELDSPQLVESLDRIIDRIRAEVAGNPQVFAQVLEPLQKLMVPIAKAYTIRLERIVESCEGGQRLEYARRLVEREIDARIGGKTVPSLVVSLIDGGWRQSLVLTFLRQGTDSEDWRRQWASIDQLLAWLGKFSPFNMPSRKSIQELKKYILERLSNISAEPAVIARIAGEIDDLLLDEDGKGATSSYVEVPPADMAREQAEAALRERLQGFRVGDWLRFAMAPRTWAPLCLAWVGQTPPHYVFVNRKGIKTLELDAAKFVQSLEEQRANRMENPDELGLVERTAKSLLSTLREHLR